MLTELEQMVVDAMVARIAQLDGGTQIYHQFITPRAGSDDEPDDRT